MFKDNGVQKYRGDHPYDICCKNTIKNWHEAVDVVLVDKTDGTMWVSNDEYETQVNFCPFCRKKAAKQITQLNFCPFSKKKATKQVEV